MFNLFLFVVNVLRMLLKKQQYFNNLTAHNYLFLCWSFLMTTHLFINLKDAYLGGLLTLHRSQRKRSTAPLPPK